MEYNQTKLTFLLQFSHSYNSYLPESIEVYLDIFDIHIRSLIEKNMLIYQVWDVIYKFWKLGTFVKVVQEEENQMHITHFISVMLLYFLTPYWGQECAHIYKIFTNDFMFIWRQSDSYSSIYKSINYSKFWTYGRRHFMELANIVHFSTGLALSKLLRFAKSIKNRKNLWSQLYGHIRKFQLADLLHHD